MIPLFQKAANVCVHCRNRKQRCDRMLPQCDKCAAKKQACDYTPPVPSTVHKLEPLVIHHRSCGHADLSPYGAIELVQAVKACIDAPLNSNLATDLLDLVSDVLGTVGFNLSDALTEFGPCIQQWCPILVEDHILGNCDYKVAEPVDAREGPQDPIIWMGLWLVLRSPCSPQEGMRRSELHATLKQVHALWQYGLRLEIRSIQLGLLIAVFELGHGQSQQAFQTLATCAATLRCLELDAERRQEAGILKIMRWLKTSVAMLDRQVCLSMVSDCLPLNLPPDHPVSKSLNRALKSEYPQQPARTSATSPWKVFVRTGVAIAAGNALGYVHSRQQGLEPYQSYDEVDASANLCISMLVVKPTSPGMFHCDAVPMIFCSHILLQTTQIQYLHASHSTTSARESDYQKAVTALKFSRGMAWQMVRTALQLRSELSVSKTTFAGLCSVLRAGLAVLESAKYVEDEVIEPGELDGYARLLRSFAQRWPIGNEYIARAEKILGCGSYGTGDASERYLTQPFPVNVQN
ncbi:hypothetical protein FB567DRAFT_522621 [Paraphoma chrysanthemicola]|uniref:Zn(2)-C6 fungal-type domain-containing protein n=1 Tax=Paraphoma chrysanthemicola TaxID=798071 RepID=A0A8K0R992_9PLEO|nr:hypothetical protein FB567DRAFT_522621 [Paraphoma chrysanthemicola]